MIDIAEKENELKKLEEKRDRFGIFFFVSLILSGLYLMVLRFNDIDDSGFLGLFSFIACILPFVFFFLAIRLRNQALDLFHKILQAKAVQAEKNDKQKAKENIGNLKAACMEVFAQNHRPKTSYPVTVCFYTLENLPTIRKFGKGDLCKKKDCWIDEGENPALCISNTIEDLKLFLKRNPEWFATVAESKQRIIFARIPLSDISHYSVIGSINNHQTVTGGNATGYTGVSVNGIGFGSIDRDPVVVHDRVTDDRMVELVYLDGIEPKTMLFSYESLPVLRKLLPQFDRP